MTSSRDELQEALAKLDEKAITESGEVLAELMQKTLMSGIRPKAALQISDEVMEGIYGYAYNMYNRGMYSEASHIFRLLMMLDYTQVKYLMGLAACVHMQKDYESAVSFYTMATFVDGESPIAHYHCADCYLKLDQATEASFELEEAINKAGDREEFKTLVERSKLMVESLADRVKAEQAEFE